MVTVDTIGRVRRAYWVQKKKIKAIARELRLSRGTVRRIVRGGETAPVYERKDQPLPKLGPFVEHEIRPPYPMPAIHSLQNAPNVQSHRGTRFKFRTRLPSMTRNTSTASASQSMR
jgi:hypothetical protein